MIVATKIFVYYDAFEQSLAAENVAAMRLVGVTIGPFDAPGMSALQVISWYRKR